MRYGGRPWSAESALVAGQRPDGLYFLNVYSVLSPGLKDSLIARVSVLKCCACCTQIREFVLLIGEDTTAKKVLGLFLSLGFSLDLF
jgi:hypothetical protein